MLAFRRGFVLKRVLFCPEKGLWSNRWNHYHPFYGERGGRVERTCYRTWCAVRNNDRLSFLFSVRPSSGWPTRLVLFPSYTNLNPILLACVCVSREGEWATAGRNRVGGGDPRYTYMHVRIYIDRPPVPPTKGGGEGARTILGQLYGSE